MWARRVRKPYKLPNLRDDTVWISATSANGCLSLLLSNPQEVAAVLNLATETARDIVANGDIVDFGDLGTLKPSFKSKAVEVGTPFRAQVHIEKPVVRLVASSKYFTLTDVAYEQVTKKETKKKEEGGIGKKKPGPEPEPVPEP